MANWDNSKDLDKQTKTANSTKQKIAIAALILIGFLLVLSIVLPLVLK